MMPIISVNCIFQSLKVIVYRLTHINTHISMRRQ